MPGHARLNSNGDNGIAGRSASRAGARGLENLGFSPIFYRFFQARRRSAHKIASRKSGAARGVSPREWIDERRLGISGSGQSRRRGGQARPQGSGESGDSSRSATFSPSITRSFGTSSTPFATMSRPPNSAARRISALQMDQGGDRRPGENREAQQSLLDPCRPVRKSMERTSPTRWRRKFSPARRRPAGRPA